MDSAKQPFPIYFFKYLRDSRPVVVIHGFAIP